MLVMWMTTPVAPDNILENVNDGCRSGCSSKRSACLKAELKCTGLCGCNNCMNIKDGDNTMVDDDENDEFDEDVEVEADDMFAYIVSQVCKYKALQ